MSSTRFQILLATPGDFETLAVISTKAFTGSAISRLFFPNSDEKDSLSPERIKKRAEGMEKGAKEGNIFLKAVLANAETGEDKIVGVGQWLPPEHARTPVTEAPPGSDKELLLRFSGALFEKEKELFSGRPHYYCHLIVVDPEYQRQNIGAALVQWGTEVADKRGLPSYIEATPAGLGLYRRLGFVDKYNMDIEDRQGQVMRTVCMIREPQTQ